MSYKLTKEDRAEIDRLGENYEWDDDWREAIAVFFYTKGREDAAKINETRDCAIAVRDLENVLYGG